MQSFTETTTQTQPAFLTRMRRLSKSGFLCESNSKCPRLDKMIAHVNLFDKTTRFLEEDLTKQQADVFEEQRVQSNKPHAKPQLTRGGSEDRPYSTTETIVAFSPEVMKKPQRDDCVFVVEVEQVEDIDDDT
ncbi:hypothetical protein H2198_001437 [Neophaeococcomyces mojaviensis]|uniref:Uncharacterized protein n=1 Tax=Neophaeococcomyces mojaviensis TaxID=3383035 RepID=A0ACC3AH61_9EURO|nr:hypothetical protein H2198_001437 [Knufia sp. JES_112]